MLIGMTSSERVSSAFARNRTLASFAFEVSFTIIGLVRSKYSESLSASIGIRVPSLTGIFFEARHSCEIISSLSSVSWIRSHRSARIILPISDTTTRRNRSSSMLAGKSLARRSMMASRASCILIFRSSDSD